MTPHRMAERGITTHVLPSTSSASEVQATGADAVFLANGPGDPATADVAVATVRQLLDGGLPVFGICFGHQVLGRAFGFGTYKLSYGHRGINQPVLDRATGKVEITAHNHGFAVDAPIDRRDIDRLRRGRGQSCRAERRRGGGVARAGAARIQRPVPPRGRGGSPRRGLPVRSLRRVVGRRQRVRIAASVSERGPERARSRPVSRHAHRQRSRGTA